MDILGVVGDLSLSVSDVAYADGETIRYFIIEASDGDQSAHVHLQATEAALLRHWLNQNLPTPPNAS